MSALVDITFREATESDLTTLIEMLANDQLGAEREVISLPIDSAYLSAFQQICSDPNNELIVVESQNMVIGMLQLTFIPYLSHKGATRCLIEAVRVHEGYQGQGIGTHVFRWAIARAKDRKCHIVQLTSNKQRTDAIRFYKNLGFEPTHEGFKLKLF